MLALKVAFSSLFIYSFALYCTCQIGNPGVGKVAFWIDAGVHPREWISIAVAVWIIDHVTFVVVIICIFNHFL